MKVSEVSWAKHLTRCITPGKFLYMDTNWTATLTTTTAVGPKQLGFTAKAGTTVTLLADPAKQDGDLIAFRAGRNHGVARIANLTNIKAN